MNKAILKVFYSKLHIEGLHPSGWYWSLDQELEDYAIHGSRGAYPTRRAAALAGVKNKVHWENC